MSKVETNKEKEIAVNIPLGRGEKEGAYIPVRINGKITQIKKGTLVKVSQEIYDTLKEAKYI